MKLIPQAYAKIFINSKNRTVTLYKNTYIHIGIKQVFLKNDSEVYFSDEADYSIRYFLINKKSIDKSIVNDYAWENTVDDFKIVNYRSELLYNGEWYIAFILSIHDSNIITSLPDEHYVIDDKTFETLKNKTEIIPRNGRYINFIHNERKVVIPKGTYIRVNKKIIFVLNEVNVFYSDSLDYSVRVLNINPEVIKNATNNSDVELTSEDFSIDSYLSFNNSSWINLFTFTLTPIKPDLPVTSYQINGASPIESLTDIVSLNGGYIELRSKLADIRKYYGIYGDKHNGNKPFNIIFTADAHNSSYCLKRIISFKNTFSEYIDDILHCGDVVSDQFADDNPLASITGGEYVLNVIGNHDNWDSKNAIEQTVNQRVP